MTDQDKDRAAQKECGNCRFAMATGARSFRVCCCPRSKNADSIVRVDWVCEFWEKVDVPVL